MGSPPSLRWLHSDPSLAAAMTAAETRARSGNWAGASEAEVRAFFVRAMTAAASVGRELPHPAPTDATTLIVSIQPSPRTDEKELQDGLLRAIAALILGTEREAKSFAYEGSKTAYTIGSDPGLSTPATAAFGWPAVVAVITVAGVLATLVYGLVSQSNELEYTKLVTDTKRQELATTLQTTVEVIEKHKQREAAAGQSLPYDEAELRFLESLEKSTAELTSWTPPAPKSIPKVDKVPEIIAGGIAKGTESIGSGLGFAAPAAALLLVYMLTR